MQTPITEMFGIEFPILADPQCFIAGVLKERAGLDLYIDRDKWLSLIHI